jgi:hypothetical protein
MLIERSKERFVDRSGRYGTDGKLCLLKNASHNRSVFLPVQSVVLLNAEPVDPDVFLAKLPSHFDSI